MKTPLAIALQIFGLILKRNIYSCVLQCETLFPFNSESILNEEDVNDDDEGDDIDDDEDDSEVKEENGVLVLNDANFDSFVEGKDTVLLEFYAPW